MLGVLLLNYRSIVKEYIKYLTKFKFILGIVILSLIFCNSVKAYSNNTSYITNTFYKQVINYTLPMAKVISSNEGQAISLNPFKLGENSMVKINTKTSQEQNIQEQNMPNKEVVIYNPALKNSNLSSKPEVFVYHSHNSEGYVLSGAADDIWNTSKNVTGVGEVLTNELEGRYGISVVHDETVHNVVYKNSYLRSSQTVDRYLKTFGDFKLIIDLHRDSTIGRNAVVTKFNGVNVARYEFVMCKGNPHFAKNMMVVNKLMSISEKLFPGLLRAGPEAKGVYYYNTGMRYYNQDKSNNAMLIEVGSNMNTPEEAREAAKYLARIIAEYVNGKN